MKLNSGFLRKISDYEKTVKKQKAIVDKAHRLYAGSQKELISQFIVDGYKFTIKNPAHERCGEKMSVSNIRWFNRGSNIVVDVDGRIIKKDGTLLKKHMPSIRMEFTPSGKFVGYTN